MSSNNCKNVVIEFENTPGSSSTSTSFSEPSSGFEEEKNSPGQYQTITSSVQISNAVSQENHVPRFEQNSNNSTSNDSATNSNEIAISVPEESQTQDSSSRSNIERHSAYKFFDNYISLITILSLKAIYDHREGILLFIGLLVTFTHSNSVLRREIAKQSHRRLLSLCIVFLNLSVGLGFIFFVFQSHKLYRSLIFFSPVCELHSVWDLLWLVGVTDFLIKFMTIQIKVGIACIPAKMLQYSARGKWFLLLECFSQVYRGLVPVQPWVYYLLAAYQNSEMGNIFVVVYLFHKGIDLSPKIRAFIKALWNLVKNTNIGKKPTNEEIEAAGSQCPICQDEYNNPILLHCGHIFCEGCVTTWFDREQTCPLCRAKVTNDPSWRDGATSFCVQLF